VTLADRLAAPLDRARVRTRTDGRGGQLAYLETHDVIRAANDIFGFGKWGHEVVDLRPITPVTVHNKSGTAGVSVGYICVVRLTVDGCVPMSGVGFGDAVEYRESAPVTAHELAAKEAESDALKRALKNFGDQFGLALYDKHASQSPHITSKNSPAPSGVASADGGAPGGALAADAGGGAGGGGPEQPATAPVTDESLAEKTVRVLDLVSKFNPESLGNTTRAIQKHYDLHVPVGNLTLHDMYLNRCLKAAEENLRTKGAQETSAFQAPKPKAAA